MNNNYEHYNMKLTTLSPVFIGDGKELLKKEYILKDNVVMIPDMQKLYQTVCAKRAEKEFARFLVGQEDKNLGEWLEKPEIDIEILPSFIKYQFEIDKNMQKDKKNRLKNILTFVKDPYGNPYVPGSSIKGMIRTALLAYFLSQWKVKYKRISKCLEDVEKRCLSDSEKESLEESSKKIEQEVFHTLKKDTENKDTEKQMESMLNSIMRGLIVSDSKPLNPKDLILAQKIDVSTKGKERGFPVYREAIKPNTEIQFTLSFDTEYFKIPLNTILVALRFFNEASNKYFYKHFKRGNNDVDTVYLGGGVGFLSKTILYPVFQEKGLQMAQRVFEKTLSSDDYEKHHKEDIELGVSPHVCKCTRYNGKLYNMGICRIEVEKS